MDLLELLDEIGERQSELKVAVLDTLDEKTPEAARANDKYGQFLCDSVQKCRAEAARYMDQTNSSFNAEESEIAATILNELATKLEASYALMDHFQSKGSIPTNYQF